MMQVNSLRSRTFRAGLLFAVALANSGCERSTKEVSGPAFCRQFDLEKAKTAAASITLESARALRDFYIECDVGLKYTKDALEWARKASELGGDEDKRIYQGLVEANSTAKS
jgi:hypothetical protein